MNPAELVELLVILTLVGGTGAAGYGLVRRARARRQRQIESAGEARPSVTAGRGRPALTPEPEEVPGDEDASAEAEGEAEPSADLEEPESIPAAPAPERVREPPAAKVIPFPVPPPAERAPAPAPVPTPADVAAPLPVEKPAPAAPPRLRKRDARALAPGLARTRAGWVSRLGELFAGKKEIDPALVSEIEKVLLSADIGVRTSQKLLEEIRSSLGRKELADSASVWTFLRRRSAEMLSLDAAPISVERAAPFVLLVIGVNGSGKTTTIGKLAAKFIADGKKVVLAAGDTFRAAAVEQLDIWARRVGATLVRGKEGADPSSVVFDAIKSAAAGGFDLVIADTAGRLHTKTDLMEELQKVRRVAGKAADGAPHETWLVLDATSGQNAIAQAQIFTQAMAVSGIVLTKLDGTAKGGVILGIADQLKVPVRYVGIGERLQDLREFDAEEFTEALYEGSGEALTDGAQA